MPYWGRLTSRRAAGRRPSSRSAASPSATARTLPKVSPRRMPCSDSTTTRTSPTRLRRILSGEQLVPHVPRDRRLAADHPIDRRTARAMSLPGHAQQLPDLPAGISPASGPRAVRRRLGDGPMAPLKLASGCDRRCTFCAIPTFRGSFVSRRPTELLDEARWLAGQGVRELFLVSENSTSYGKDLGDLRLLETLLPDLAAVEGVRRVRVSYLQPAELRPGLIQAIAATPGVAPYFDLSFQHAALDVLRRMRRFETRTGSSTCSARSVRSTRTPVCVATSSWASRRIR